MTMRTIVLMHQQQTVKATTAIENVENGKKDAEEKSTNQIEDFLLI